MRQLGILISKCTEASDKHSNSISIKRGYTEFECPSSGSLNNRPIATIYNQSQGPNPTGNISLVLNFKRRLVVLALRVLLSNKKSLECSISQKWK